MVSATFIFKKGTYDDEFFRLDESIERANQANPEYLGKDSWENPSKGLTCVVYYYQSMKGVTDLKNIRDHKTAKANYQRWYDGYHVVLSEITGSYGDGTIEHPTPALDY